MEQARRPALAHHVHRIAPMGAWVLINETWYNSLTWNNRGTVLYDLKRYEDAVADFDKATLLDTYFYDAFCSKGNSLCQLKRYDEAFAAYDKALSIKPDLAEAWLGRGNVFFALNRDEEAIYHYDKALELKKDFSDVYYNKSFVKLSLGEYDEGWSLYEWRWKIKSFTLPRNFNQPLWLGHDNIVGKTILVHSEQGFGDTIQFYRYFSKLKALGCEIIFETQAPLVSLFKAQKDNCQIISHGDPLPSFGVHCPLLSLPFAFQTTLKTIPASVPYLFPPTEKHELLRAKLCGNNKPRIGLAWSGNRLHKNDIRRSVALETLSPIISEQFEWFSIQKDVRNSDLIYLQEVMLIKDLSAHLNDFTDTAEIIDELDLAVC